MRKMEKVDKSNFTIYEKARVLGARALQIAMDAPLLTEIDEKKLDEINYDPMEIAKIELEADALPISVKQPLPEKKSVKVKKAKEEKKTSDKEVVEAEIEEEKGIGAEGEIMELANPEDEVEEDEAKGREASEELQ
jgi:DNA-directed RNA polymerase subunit K/omega